MNFDMSQYYEKNLNKYYSQLDIYFSKILIYKKNQINDIIASLEDVFSLAKKESKDYIIYLSLNEKRQYSQLKIKSIETRIKEYENKIKSIKNKNKIIDDIPTFKEEEMSNIKIKERTVPVKIITFLSLFFLLSISSKLFLDSSKFPFITKILLEVFFIPVVCPSKLVNIFFDILSISTVILIALFILSNESYILTLDIVSL